MTTYNDIYKVLEAQKAPRSAWQRGIKNYALDILDGLDRETASRQIASAAQIEHALLNGADNWAAYSYGGGALVYDGDIAKALCTPSELKRKDGGRLQPNSRENWLDVQARALYQACRLIKNIYRKLNK